MLPFKSIGIDYDLEIWRSVLLYDTSRLEKPSLDEGLFKVIKIFFLPQNY